MRGFSRHIPWDGELAIHPRRSGVGVGDPLAQTLEVLKLDGATYRLIATHRDDAVVRAVAIELAALWQR